MNDPVYHELRDLAARRPLTPAEEARLEAWLTAHPEARADWEQEAALDRLLRELPPAPVSSNFKVLVLQALDAEERAAARAAQAAPWRLSWRNIFSPRVASVGLLLALGVAGAFEYRTYTRTQLARGVRDVSSVVALTGPDVLQDFEAIHELPAAPAKADLDLLAALQ
ncbi:MAG: hypothetical protein EXS33_02130 [Pedosphaera sp.]|nr:hypothetical protein [Pedosphaera sp.]